MNEDIQKNNPCHGGNSNVSTNIVELSWIHNIQLFELFEYIICVAPKSNVLLADLRSYLEQGMF